MLDALGIYKTCLPQISKVEKKSLNLFILSLHPTPSSYSLLLSFWILSCDVLLSYIAQEVGWEQGKTLFLWPNPRDMELILLHSEILKIETKITAQQ